MKRRVHVEAPAEMEPLEVAQAIVGPHVHLRAEHTHTWVTRPFVIWAPLQDLYERTLRMYTAHIEKMMEAVNAALGVDGLEKAIKPLLTPARVREIAKLIQDYHTAFIVSAGMRDQADPVEIDRLVRMGILPPDAADFVTDGYLFGQLVATIRELGAKQDLKEMTYPEFKEAIAKKPIALTEEQKRAIEWAKHSAAVHIQGLGNRIADDFSRRAVAEDAELRRKYETMIRTKLVENIERGASVRKLASELANQTGDWTRDFGRIAATEKQQAFQEGFAAKLRDEEGDPRGVYVAKIPKPDACPDCVRLHLTAGVGSRPRLFTLAQLTENGTNRGKKRGDWQAVVGTVHPWCACELVHVPAGWAFERKPSGSGYKKVDGRDAWMTPNGKPWRPRLMPDPLRRGDIFTRDLAKSFLTYDVPDQGVTIRINDPAIYREVESVIAKTPAWLFRKDTGVTLITWDHPRPQVPLTDHDLAYWTGNEIRLSHHLELEKVATVLRHEFGHAPNVFLIRKWGGEAPVRRWHQLLFDVAKEEGFVSHYASTAPIECAAEATRLYLYDRPRLMMKFPRQFTALHVAYKGITGDADENHLDGRVRGQQEPEWARQLSPKLTH